MLGNMFAGNHRFNEPYHIASSPHISKPSGPHPYRRHGRSNAQPFNFLHLQMVGMFLERLLERPNNHCMVLINVNKK